KMWARTRRAQRFRIQRIVGPRARGADPGASASGARTSKVQRWKSVVMMSARSVDVPVGELFLGGGAHVRDLDVEIEVLAGQRVIAVDGDHVPDDLCDSNGARAPIRVDLKLHADLHVRNPLE